MQDYPFTVCIDNKAYKADRFVLRPNSDTNQNVWYCDLENGNSVDANRITMVAFPITATDMKSGIQSFRQYLDPVFFFGDCCVLDFFEWLDTNKDTLEFEGYSIDDYRSVSSS